MAQKKERTLQSTFTVYRTLAKKGFRLAATAIDASGGGITHAGFGMETQKTGGTSNNVVCLEAKKFVYNARTEIE